MVEKLHPSTKTRKYTYRGTDYTVIFISSLDRAKYLIDAHSFFFFFFALTCCITLVKRKDSANRLGEHLSLLMENCTEFPSFLQLHPTSELAFPYECPCVQRSKSRMTWQRLAFLVLPTRLGRLCYLQTAGTHVEFSKPIHFSGLI